MRVAFRPQQVDVRIEGTPGEAPAQLLEVARQRHTEFGLLQLPAILGRFPAPACYLDDLIYPGHAEPSSLSRNELPAVVAVVIPAGVEAVAWREVTLDLGSQSLGRHRTITLRVEITGVGTINVVHGVADAVAAVPV
jgi:hypothetical protein